MNHTDPHDPKRARVWDKDWTYVPKDSSDIRATFKRIAEQQKEAKAPANVTALKRRDAK